MAAADPSVTEMLIGDQVKPLGTHSLCPRTRGLDVVPVGKTWATDVGLGAEVALGGPGCPRRDDYLALSDSRVDTPLPPILSPYALPDEWLDIFAKLTALPRLPANESVDAHPSTLLGCGVFSECVEQSRVHAVKIDIDAIESTARSLLDDGLGVDQAIMAGHISAIRTQGMGQALKRMSDQMLPSTLHPRPHLISVPPDRHPPLPVQQHPTCVVKLTTSQETAMEEHCARIPPPLLPAKLDHKLR